MISVQPKGANLEASAYFNDNIRKRCATAAIRPINAIKNHSVRDGLTQTEGTNKLIIAKPTKLVNNKVKKELSDVLNFLVIIK